MQCSRPSFDPWVRKIPWRRKSLPISVFLPEEFHGQRSLVGYSPRGCKEAYTTERQRMHTHRYAHTSSPPWKECLSLPHWGYSWLWNVRGCDVHWLAWPPGFLLSAVMSQIGGVPGVWTSEMQVSDLSQTLSQSQASQSQQNHPQPSDPRERNEYLLKHHPVCVLHHYPNHHHNNTTTITLWQQPLTRQNLEDNHISMPYTYPSSIIFDNNHTKKELFYKWGFLGFKITANGDGTH